MIYRNCLLAGAWLAAAGALSAGVRMKGEQVQVKSNEVTQQTVMLDNNRMRIDMVAPKSNTSMMLLGEGDGVRMVMLDRARNEYREMDKKTFQEMSQKMQGAMAQMNEAMSKMTPEQRAMMEKMMKGRMGQMGAPAAAAPRTVYTAKGSATVNGFRCTQYEGTREGQKVAEICAADPAQLNVSPADFSGFEKLRELFADMQKALASSPFAGMLQQASVVDQGINGFPVQILSFRNGELVSKSETKEVTRTSFSDADFSVGNARKIEMNLGGSR